jgi:hypothetical protein
VRFSVAATALLLAGCPAPHRQLSLVPSLPTCVTPATVNTVRVTAEGDFPPEATLTAAASPTTPAELDLPRATRAVVVEGFGPTGLAAFGHTGTITLDDVGGGRIGVAYGPPDGLCATSGPLLEARSGHHATLLGDGGVLVTGGTASGGEAAATAIERFEPATSTFALTGQPLRDEAALMHATAPLPDGGVLLSGGTPVPQGTQGVIAFAGALRFDAHGKLVGQPRLLLDARAAHSATALPDGRVLLAGGCRRFDGAGACAETLTSTELYDAGADSFVPGPPLLHARWGHDAVGRGDGTVLLVGGRGEGGGAVPAEIVDPDEFRSFDAGAVTGSATALPTGSVFVAGGTGTSGSGASLWLSPAEMPLALPALPAPRTAPSLTTLDDGAVLVAGGGDAGLALFDGRGALSSLPDAFTVAAAAAVRLADGTVVLTGGNDAGGNPSTQAALFFHSPLSAWSSLPPLTLDGAADAYLPRRPDRASAAGQLVVTAAAPAADGRPAEYAIIAGMQVADFAFDLLAGRRGDAASAALLVGWRSEAAYDFVVVEPGRAVELWSVSSPRAGQTVAAPVAGCRGSVVADGALPDGDLAPLHVDWRAGTLTVYVAGAQALRCRPPDLGRGAVGVGALRGTAAFDNLALTR